VKRPVALLLAAGLALPLPAETTPPSAQDVLIEGGLTDLYNLQYAAARKKFTQLSEKFPDQPLGAYALAMALWWELTNEFDEQNDALEKEFLATVDRAVSQSTAALPRDDDGSALLCLGGALGLRGRWDAIQGHWIKAYRDGKRAFNAQRDAIKKNPHLYDAYLGVGIFHYYTATLPAVVKVLARFIFGGNKAEGLAEIRLAMTKGKFSRTAARLFLAGITLNNEKDPAGALALVRDGRKEYPRSSFFHFLELLMLEGAGDWPALKEGAEDYIAKTETKDPFYSPNHLHRGYYMRANSRLGAGDPTGALEEYDALLARFTVEDRWMTLALLHRGMAHDALGKREEALKNYRAVLTRRDVWELHNQARTLIRKPYRPPPPPTGRSG
jgi:tetratricopeptide (TPR) repeat protein